MFLVGIYLWMILVFKICFEYVCVEMFYVINVKVDDKM